MTPALDAALCAKYPLIFRNRHGDMRTTLMCWGLEVGDGWYDLIDTTCALIYAPYTQARQLYARAREQEGTTPYPGAKPVTAITVERARLKMSETGDSLPVAVQIKEKFGTLRFYVDGANETTYAYIEFAQQHSECVCEQCGAPGKLRDGGWMKVRCANHQHEN